MANPPLTDNFIKALTAPAGKRVEIFDQKISGLVLRVSSQGRKTWVLRYRTEGGRQPRFTIGTYPALKLADARHEALRLLAQTKTGDDPASERRRSRQAVKSAPVRTFGELFDAYIDASRKGHWKPRKKQKRERTISDEESVYRRYLKTKLGTTFIEDIQRSTVKKILRDLMDKGIKAQTIQVQAVIRQTFAFGIAEYDDLILINPATGFGVIGTTKPRTRTLNDAELREFWHAVLDPPKFLAPSKKGKVLPLYLSRSMGIALQLCTLLLVRENEVAGMRLDELNFDTKTWLISGDRMKAGLPHLVPLTDEAIDLIEEAIALRPSDKLDYVFPSPRWRIENKGVLPSSIYHAMVDIIGAKKMKHATPHDLRRTGSTALTSERIGVLPFIRSKVLGHTTDTGGGSAVSIVPWVRPWSRSAAPLGMPRSAASRKNYSGINILILWDAVIRRGFAAQEWLTFRQALSLGGHVRKGERGTVICYADSFIPKAERERVQTGGDDPSRIPFLKRFTVFNVEQCEGLPAHIVPQPPIYPETEKHPAAEGLIAASGATIREAGGEAFYHLGEDFIRLPRRGSFVTPADYYCTALHELGHWTAHPARLARDLTGRFGSTTYAREELIAELTSAFLCAHLGIIPQVRHADYLANWLAVLKADSRAIFHAASQASKASDFVLAIPIQAQAGAPVAA